MTFLGKLFTILNAVIAAALMTWAVAAYTHRIDWAAVEYEKGKKLDDKVKEYAVVIKRLQGEYGPAMNGAAQAEADLEHRRKRIAERRQEAREGTFYNQYTAPGDRGAVAVEDPRDDSTDPALPNYRQIWGKLADAKRMLGVDGKPIRGLDKLQAALTGQIADAVKYSDEFSTTQEQHYTVTKELADLKYRTERQGRIRSELAGERESIDDARVNYDEQLATLLKRNKQLLGRLTAYEPK